MLSAQILLFDFHIMQNKELNYGMRLVFLFMCSLRIHSVDQFMGVIIVMVRGMKGKSLSIAKISFVVQGGTYGAVVSVCPFVTH